MTVTDNNLLPNITLLSDLPEHITSVQTLCALLDRVKQSQLCTVNPDNDFVNLITKEGGRFLGTGGRVVAFLDTGSEIDHDVQVNDKTVRASDCMMLSDGRCAKCTRYRPTYV